MLRISDLTLTELFLKVHQFALDHHILKFDSVCWFRLRRWPFLRVLYVMDIISTLFDVVLNGNLHMVHHQIKFIC